MNNFCLIRHKVPHTPIQIQIRSVSLPFPK